jgi:DNA-binding NtrC family response regulator
MKHDADNARRLNGVRVLLVEDWAPLARELRQQFQDAGAIVVGPAGRLDDALALARAAHLDVAVLDMDLHNKPATPVARLLRSRGIPFVLVSGFDASEVPDDLADVPFLEKPLFFDDLRSAVLRSFEKDIGRPRHEEAE